MRHYRLFSLSAFALLAALAVAANAGAARDLPHVTGAGRTAALPFVQLNARATAPADLATPAPAVGSFRASTTSFGTQSGTVECIAMLTDTSLAISGSLDIPITDNGFTYPDFILLVETAGNDVTYIHLVVGDLAFIPDCGLPLFFRSPPINQLPEDLVAQGHLGFH
jgi:hypothetical protein